MRDTPQTTLERECEWSHTELGQLFARFDKAHAMYWGTDVVTKEICDEVAAARVALLLKIRGW